MTAARPRLERAQGDRSRSAGAAVAEYRIELLTFGETLAAATDVDRLAATARRSDLSGALADRRRALSPRHAASPASIVLSDGGDTAPQEARGRPRDHARRFSPSASAAPSCARDREVVNLTAGEPLLPGASIDLSVSATSTGFGTRAGRAARQRQWPAGRSAPRDAVRRRRADSRRCSPSRPSPTCRRSTPWRSRRRAASSRPRTTRRSVLVPPQTGTPQAPDASKARPGYEHTFLKRALADDPGLDVDAVVRKGQNDDGPRYVLRAGRAVADGGAVERAIRRSDRSCSPTTRVIFGNIEADFFTREQLELTTRLRRRARRRPAGARRALVRSPGPGRHGARAGAAGRSDRSARRPSRWRRRSVAAQSSRTRRR